MSEANRETGWERSDEQEVSYVNIRCVSICCSFATVASLVVNSYPPTRWR